jgi:hypothetical protein
LLSFQEVLGLIRSDYIRTVHLQDTLASNLPKVDLDLSRADLRYPVREGKCWASLIHHALRHINDVALLKRTEPTVSGSLIDDAVCEEFLYLGFGDLGHATPYRVGPL